MRPVRKQRMQIIILLMVAVAIISTIILYALRQNINLFFTPTQIANGEAPIGREIRAGGLVVNGSVERSQVDLYVEFVITDTAEQVRVSYDGILPDLFREGQGIIAIGSVDEEGIVRAKQVLAKHDEQYMPPEIQKAIEDAGHVSKDSSGYEEPSAYREPSVYEKPSVPTYENSNSY